MTEANQPVTRRSLRAAQEPTAAAAAPATPPAPRRGVLQLIGTALMACALVLILALGAVTIVIPAATGSTALTVLTGSMEPSLPPGTLVVVRPTDPADIQAGQVITYQLKSGEPTLVTHRVTQRLITADGEVQFITQGDANPEPDPEPIRAVQVRGTVWYAIPVVGHVANLVTGSARGVIVPVAVVALFSYAAWMFTSGLRDRRRDRRNTAAADA